MNFVHPGDPGISGLRHIMWTGAPKVEGSHARNAVFYGEKAIDRSPCGTGTFGASGAASCQGPAEDGRGFLCTNPSSARSSAAASRLRRLLPAAPAIMPSVAGWARMTGLNTIFIDDRDPFAKGFSVHLNRLVAAQHAAGLTIVPSGCVFSGDRA